MNTLYARMLILGLFGVVQMAYVPEKASQETPLNIIPCPEECVCWYVNMTAECDFHFEDYSIQEVFPWQLTKLSIHGNDRTWYSKFASESVKNVLLSGSEKLNKSPKEIFESSFSQLTNLDISYIPIKRIAALDFKDLPGLRTLRLRHSNVSTVHPNAFRNMCDLETLNLDGNKLSNLPKDLLMDLKSLKSLQLRSNRLTILREEQFNDLEKLEHLNLQSNMLKQLETFLPSLNISSLRSLDVRGNEIRYILEEAVEKMKSLESVDLSSNPLECTCVIDSFIQLYQDRPSMFKGDVFCEGPSEIANVNIRDLDIAFLPCVSAYIGSVSESSDVLYQTNLVLDCTAEGSEPLSVYWQTPWGEEFSAESSKLMFPDSYASMKTDESYSESNLYLESRIYMNGRGSLIINKFRGHFAGQFTCFAENLIGSSNSSVTVGIVASIRSNYVSSLFIGAFVSSGMLVLATIIGLTRLFVNKCLHSNKCSCCCCHSDDMNMEIFNKITTNEGEIEVTYVCTDYDTIEYIDSEYCQSPPHPPVNSPMYRLSPDRCRTPDNEPTESDPVRGSSQHIWNQLEEVKERLRMGAGKKIKKVRSQVRSITDTGMLQLQL